MIEAIAELAEDGPSEMLGKVSVGAAESVDASVMEGKVSVGASEVTETDGPRRC